MKENEPPPNLPFGSGHEIVEEREKMKLPAVEVKNSVVFANPAFKEGAPFDVVLGKPTKLGVFFTPEPGAHEGERVMEPKLLPEGKTRSGLMGSAIFRDRDGNLWRDVDAKGIGLVSGTVENVYNISDKPDELKAKGLVDYNYAIGDSQMAERLLKAGIRTYRVIGITLLEEIVIEENDGTIKKIPIKEAEERGMIPKGMQPVAEIRAFGTKERIYSVSSGGRERAEAALKDAKLLVAQELGIKPDEFSTADYLEWFAKTLGKEVAKLHKLKLVHIYLTYHNIALDCRIVDLDSVDKEGSDDNHIYSRDIYSVKDSLWGLVHVIRRINIAEVSQLQNVEYYQDLFKKSYDEELALKKRGARREK